jgi:sigma-B regulation protein RsbU (phosphoserine phosphatase)
VTTQVLTPLPVAGRHRITVLLVDDQAMVAEAVRRMLEAETDVDFHACEDPAEALDRAAAVKPTVMLLDLVMPGIDGLTLLKFARANDATRDVPIIVLSSKEEAATKAEAFEHGANDYIVKLPDPIELIARIRHHSRGYIAHIERNEAYAALEQSRQALAGELAQAAAYVRSILPSPESGAISTDWRFIPSVQLGGDAFGYHWLDEDHFALFLLDVSGHGVKSALLSMTAMNAIRTRTLPDVDFLDPAQVLAALNAAFQMDLYDGMYFTIWYGVFDRRTRRLTYGDAGHPAGLLVSREGGSVNLTAVGEPGFIIGMLPDATFTCAEVDVPPSATLLLFSDGAYEITRPDGSVWTLDDFTARVRDLASAADLAPLASLEDVLREVRGGERFEDDVSILKVVFGSDTGPPSG